MANPLLLMRPPSRRRGQVRRAQVAIPTDIPATDAIFLLVRRMRMPLIALVVVFTISVFGLAAIPGVDGDGNPRHLSVFEAFYFMSYTATTIGFGEIPYAFTSAQRLWVTGAIYATVITWAWTIGMILALVQEEAFRDALATQRFRRRIRHLREPFHILAGYGETGRAVAASLDYIGSRFAVIERVGNRVDRLGTDQLTTDPPGVEADAANPAVLGLAGLASPHCQGVLALTDSDEANLAIVQAVHLLKPEMPVIARSSNPEVTARMHDFGVEAVINPYDRYGDYLVLGLQRPVTQQLLMWLISPTGTPLDQPLHPIREGRWVVSAEGRFQAEITKDLQAGGYEVIEVAPGWEAPALNGVVGFVAGADKDTVNLGQAASVRAAAPDVFLALRQSQTANAALFAAFDPDSIFVPNDLVARECFARLVTPRTWAFLETAREQSDEWSQALLDRLQERVGIGSPITWRLALDGREAPAVVRWLEDDELTIGDLLRHPSDRDRFAPAVVLALTRDGELMCNPPEEERLVAGDELLLASAPNGYSYLRDALFNDASVEYAANGRVVPSTWVWRKLTHTARRAPKDVCGPAR